MFRFRYREPRSGVAIQGRVIGVCRVALDRVASLALTMRVLLGCKRRISLRCIRRTTRTACGVAQAFAAALDQASEVARVGAHQRRLLVTSCVEVVRAAA